VDFVRLPPSPSEGDPGLYARFVLKTGKTAELLKLPCSFQRRAYFNDPSALALGDPSRIAVVASETKGTTVKLLDFTEGQASVRWTVPLPNHATVGDWVSGGRDLWIVRPGPAAKSPPELWLLSAQSGELRKTELEMPGVQRGDPGSAACASNGELFFRVEERGIQEVWVMENAGRVATAQ